MCDLRIKRQQYRELLDAAKEWARLESLTGKTPYEQRTPEEAARERLYFALEAFENKLVE